MPRWFQRKIISTRFPEKPDYRIRLKDIRVDLDIDMAAMGRILQVPKVTYIYYEKGVTTEMNMEPFIKLSLMSGLSIDYMLGLTDVPEAYRKSQEIPLAVDTKRVRETRIYYDMTGKAVAEALNISSSAYSMKELHPDKLGFTIQDLILLAYLFRTSVDYLLHVTDVFQPRSRGQHNRISLSMKEVIKIRKKLGVSKVAKNSIYTEEMQMYCAEHFRLKSIRKERGLTQKEIAAVLGISYLTYGVYEKKPYNMPSYYLIKLARYYGCSLDYLVGSSDSF